MKKVASLRYGVIFKKAFCDPEIFTAFVRDMVGVEIEIDHVETEKEFDPSIGRVQSRFDLFAQDIKNRVIVDIQHKRLPDHYHRFMHYHCAALLEQVPNSYDYQPPMTVFTIVVLTSGDKHQQAVSVTDFDPKDLQGKPLGEILHKIMYLCPKYVTDNTPEPYRRWLLAIQDTLDEKVEESDYKLPQILKIFEHIEKDALSPKERAKMFDEHANQLWEEEQIAKKKPEWLAEGIAEGKAEGIAEGKAEGIVEGLAKGEKNKAIETARKMKSKKFDISLIADLTGLSVDEIDSC